MQTPRAIPRLFRLPTGPRQGRPGEFTAILDGCFGSKQSQQDPEPATRPAPDAKIPQRAALRYLGIEPLPLDAASAAAVAAIHRRYRPHLKPAGAPKHHRRLCSIRPRRSKARSGRRHARLRPRRRTRAASSSLSSSDGPNGPAGPPHSRPRMGHKVGR